MKPKEIEAYLKGKRVVDGMLIGGVATSIVNSECLFDIIEVDSLKDYSAEEVDKFLIEGLWESGMLDVYFPESVE